MQLSIPPHIFHILKRFCFRFILDFKMSTVVSDFCIPLYLYTSDPLYIKNKHLGGINTNFDISE